MYNMDLATDSITIYNIEYRSSIHIQRDSFSISVQALWEQSL